MNWTPPAWAVRSSVGVLGALVAILGKIGVRDVDSNLAVAFRTSIIVFFAWGIVAVARQCQGPVSHIAPFSSVPVSLGDCDRTVLAVLLQSASIGRASRVAPIDKLSVALAVAMAFVFLGEKPTPGNVLGAGLIVAGVLVTVFLR